MRGGGGGGAPLPETLGGQGGGSATGVGAGCSVLSGLEVVAILGAALVGGPLVLALTALVDELPLPAPLSGSGGSEERLSGLLPPSLVE